MPPRSYSSTPGSKQAQLNASIRHRHSSTSKGSQSVPVLPAISGNTGTGLRAATQQEQPPTALDRGEGSAGPGMNAIPENKPARSQALPRPLSLDQLGGGLSGEHTGTGTLTRSKSSTLVSATPSSNNQQRMLNRHYGLYEHLPIQTQIELARSKIRELTNEKKKQQRARENSITAMEGTRENSLRDSTLQGNENVDAVLDKLKKSRSERKLARDEARRDRRSKTKEGNRHGARRDRSHRGQGDRHNGARGGHVEQEDTFYKAVESPKHKKLEPGELTPRTEMAGEFTRSVMAKEWNLLQEFDSVTFLLQQECELKNNLDKRIDHKHQLEVQREAARKRAIDEKLDMRSFGKALEADAEVYKKEEEAKAISYRQKDFEQRRVRDAQWLDNKRRRQEEKALEKSEIDSMMNAAKKSLQEESDKQMKKMEMQKLWAAQMKNDNALSIQRRRDKKIADDIEDKRLMALQCEILNAQEEERVAYYASLKGKQGKNIAQYAQTVGAENERKHQEEDERIQNELKKRDEQLEAAVNAKEKWLKDLKYSGIEAVRKQLEEQSALRQQRKEEDKRFGILFSTDAEKYRQEEAEKGERRRRDARDNAAFLLKQMSERKDTVGKFGVQTMSAVERAINKPELRQAQQGFAQETIFRSRQLQLQGPVEQKQQPGQPRDKYHAEPDVKNKLLKNFAKIRVRQGAF